MLCAANRCLLTGPHPRLDIVQVVQAHARRAPRVPRSLPRNQEVHPCGCQPRFERDSTSYHSQLHGVSMPVHTLGRHGQGRAQSRANVLLPSLSHRGFWTRTH